MYCFKYAYQSSRTHNTYSAYLGGVVIVFHYLFPQGSVLVTYLKLDILESLRTSSLSLMIAEQTSLINFIECINILCLLFSQKTGYIWRYHLVMRSNIVLYRLKPKIYHDF